MFKEDLCTLCGICLENCQWQNYTIEEAIELKKELNNGKVNSAVKDCITCYGCNERCPNDANPFDLIAKIQEENNVHVSSENLKALEARYFFDKEMTGYPEEEIVMTTCVFGKSDPHLIKGELYNLPKVNGKPFFCWVLFSHSNGISIQEKHAKEFVNRLALTGAREVVCFHDDCYSLLTKLAPEYGIEVPFKPVHLSEYLVRYLKKSGKFKKLNIEIAYQRPCASRHTPEKEHFVDELFELTGVKRINREYDGVNALCCAGSKFLLGIGDPKEDQVRNFEDIKKSGVKALVCLCPVCMHTFDATAKEFGIELIFISDIVRMALGEIPVPI